MGALQVRIVYRVIGMEVSQSEGYNVTYETGNNVLHYYHIGRMRREPSN